MKKKIQKIKWPKNKKFAACLSHDVDIAFKYNLIGSLKEIKNNPKSFFSVLFKAVTKENPYWQFEKIIELEKRFDFRSTFFFCAKRRYIKDPYYNIRNIKIRNIINKLDKEGFEIGLHGSYLSYNNLKYLKEEKSILESVLNKKISGNRQHFLNFTERTSKILSELDFSYDSSFGDRNKVGFKDGKFFPFYYGKLLEIPINIMDATLFTQYGSFENAWKNLKNLIDLAIKKKALITFNWHQRVFYDLEFKRWGKLYIQILEYLKNNNAHVDTLGNIAKLYKNGRL
jgi:peptidoglycan/xylan/chitin deacetylase (PgdA/CDA1 family)|tara:strand:+ start:4129 stop:4983 length:855 start_codon:yes stop_codon:yes gene_type:complete